MDPSIYLKYVDKNWKAVADSLLENDYETNKDILEGLTFLTHEIVEKLVNFQAENTLEFPSLFKDYSSDDTELPVFDQVDSFPTEAIEQIDEILIEPKIPEEKLEDDLKALCNTLGPADTQINLLVVDWGVILAFVMLLVFTLKWFLDRKER